MIEPIERRKVYELVADKLLALVRERGLRPGDPLPTERELTQSYRVGRSSVREALRMLESSGLIRPAGPPAAKGAFIVAEYGNLLSHSLHFLVTIEEASLLELYEVRKIIEVEAAALAAARRTEHDVREMSRAIDDMVAGLESQERYIVADLRFHMAVAGSTRNRMVMRMMHAIRDLLHRALASVYQIPGSAQRSISQHREIHDAITARDAGRAREKMHEHLQRVEGDVRSVLGGEPAVSAPATAAGTIATTAAPAAVAAGRG